MKIAAGSKLVFIGDSITDCSRFKSAPEGWANALGNGYVSLVDALLTSTYGRSGVRIVNVGNSGDTVRSLKARWQSDVLDQKPDWLSVMIGTNNVWRQFDCPRQKDWHVYPDEFERLYRDILSHIRPSLKGLVLMTPFYIEANTADPMRAMMDQYGEIVRRMATEFEAIFVDTQAAFDAVLKDLPTQVLSGDRVHPTQAGHMVIARTFLNAVGYHWKDE